MPHQIPRQARGAEKPAHRSGGHPPRSGLKRDFTFNHAGRQFRFGPVTFWLSVSALIIMALWSAATATYFAFRDDVLTRLLARQADMQYAYEDRVSELRGQVDRLTSRQLLDQEQVEQRMEHLAQRQKTLEARAAAISDLSNDVATGSIRGNPHAPQRKAKTREAAPKPSPISDTVIPAPPLERRASLEPRVLTARLGLPGGKKGNSLLATLGRVQESLDRVEARQSAALLAMEDNYEGRTQRLRRIFTDLGMKAGKIAAGVPEAIGGPFVAPTLGRNAGAFERQMQHVQIARANLEKLNRVALTVPLRKPLPGDLEISSGFGVRLDPFFRRPAMHTGLDFRGGTGEPVHATGAGTVTIAGWSGGYGRMVEVNHGNGFVTRYGHMSAILVKEGQTIKPGQVVGRIGSTGRSTGPHLHYETRIDGEPVDPHKFLRAGQRLEKKI